MLQRAAAAAVATAADARDAYARAIRAIATELGWPFAAAWEPEEDADTLRCVALWHSDQAPLTAFGMLTDELSLHAGEGLPGRVWLAGRPQWVSDFAADPELPRHQAAADAGLHAAACFPVRSERGLVGVIELLGDEPRPQAKPSRSGTRRRSTPRSTVSSRWITVDASSSSTRRPSGRSATELTMPSGERWRS
ncbi:MAG: GAF domain-containing protein [Solirubrobacteraceae bacterium]